VSSGELLSTNRGQKHPASEMQTGCWEGTPLQRCTSPSVMGKAHACSVTTRHQEKNRCNALVTIYLTQASLWLRSAHLCLGLRTVKSPVDGQKTSWGWRTAVSQQWAMVPLGC